MTNIKTITVAVPEEVTPELLRYAVRRINRDEALLGTPVENDAIGLLLQRVAMRIEDADDADTNRDLALTAVTITDPTGYQMRPAEVRVERSNVPADPRPLWVVLDFGPFAKALPVDGPESAAAVAWAFINLLGCDYDLSALPETEATP